MGEPIATPLEGESPQADAAVPAEGSAPAKRMGVKELIQAYGPLAAGIYLGTSLLGFLIAFALFSSALDPAEWGFPSEGRGFWLAAAAAAWLVGVKGSQIPRLMLTATLTPVVARRMGREARQPAPAEEQL